MPAVTLTPALRAEYTDLFNTCLIRPAFAQEVETLLNGLLSHQARYEQVGNALGIPWFFVAVVHNMESSQSFNGHLHNGDPLTARTVQVPAGRPKGQPPFTWEQSAADALTLQGLNKLADWSLPSVLFQLERYNGFGYRRLHPEVLSPYLWSRSNHYTSGKFVADGTWSDTAVSKQVGAAVLLRRLAEKNLTDFTDQPIPPLNTPPLVVNHSNKKPTDPLVVAQVETLQTWLNTFPGIFVKIDGVPGDKTSEAFKRVTGHFLPGDPRAA